MNYLRCETTNVKQNKRTSHDSRFTKKYRYAQNI
jgi:hypothetical protein